MLMRRKLNDLLRHIHASCPNKQQTRFPIRSKNPVYDTSIHTQGFHSKEATHGHEGI